MFYALNERDRTEVNFLSAVGGYMVIILFRVFFCMFKYLKFKEIDQYKCIY